jgi:hypothetical protein
MAHYAAQGAGPAQAGLLLERVGATPFSAGRFKPQLHGSAPRPVDADRQGVDARPICVGPITAAQAVGEIAVGVQSVDGEGGEDVCLIGDLFPGRSEESPPSGPSFLSASSRVPTHSPTRNRCDEWAHRGVTSNQA